MDTWFYLQNYIEIEARNEEIERIVNSHKDLDIDGVMGLGNSYEEELDDEEESI